MTRRLPTRLPRPLAGIGLLLVLPAAASAGKMSPFGTSADSSNHNWHHVNEEIDPFGLHYTIALPRPSSSPLPDGLVPLAAADGADTIRSLPGDGLKRFADPDIEVPTNFDPAAVLSSGSEGTGDRASGGRGPLSPIPAPAGVLPWLLLAGAGRRRRRRG